MDVGVAGGALAAEPEIGIAPFFQFPVVDEIGLMALAAIYRLVFAGQFVAGQVVVDRIFIKTHDVEIPPVVVAVAGGAVFSFRFLRRVESGPPVDPAFNFLVATQAFVVGNFVSQNMAFRAVEHPLQIRMRLRQVARRQLSLYPECE